MANINIGQTPIIIASINTKRYTIRFQNVGETFLYLQRIPLKGAYEVVSPTNFEVILAPLNSKNGSPETFETHSILAYQIVSGPCYDNCDPCKPCPTPHKSTSVPEEEKTSCKKKCRGKVSITETSKINNYFKHY
ncbi:MAG: hypothetical protein ACOH2V_00765 [Candidatus Saccharimonadaceae bacterium]